MMTIKNVSAFAPGKLILAGEHSVVYGYQAIAMAVNLGVYVGLEEISGASYCEGADQLISEAVDSLLPSEGIKMSFQTALPLGRGMGSSAALSVALVRALAKWEDRVSDFEEEFKKGMQLETFFHGNPSGLDHTVSSLGQTLMYKKAIPRPDIMQLPPFDLRLVIIDSGSAGNTAEMVQKVKDNYAKNKDSLAKMGIITLKIKKVLAEKQTDILKLGNLFLENQALLQQIGVSTESIDNIIDIAMKKGALGAKLSGSGGGGIVMILTKNPERMLEDMKQFGYKGFIVSPYFNQDTE